MLVAMTSWIFLMRILAGIGSEAVAWFHHCHPIDDVYPDAGLGIIQCRPPPW
jgi:hypothetical protein